MKLFTKKEFQSFQLLETMISIPTISNTFSNYKILLIDFRQNQKMNGL